jgi:hypothetical protein
MWGWACPIRVLLLLLLAPRRRGTVVLPVVTRTASSILETFGGGLTVAGNFTSLARDTLGLQVISAQLAHRFRIS